MPKIPHIAIVAAAALTLFTGITMAQDTQPSIKFNLFEIDGLVISDTYSFGQDFGAEQGMAVPSPFRLHVARQDQVTPLYEKGTERGGMFIKINFTTGDADTPLSDRQLIENLQFIPMTLPMEEDLDARMQNLANLLIQNAFPQVTKNRQNVEYIGARRTQLNGIDVIDAVGRYTDADLGLMLVRITGFAHPTKPDSVYSVVNLVASHYEITNMDQMFLTGSGKTLEKFEYLD